MDWDHVRVFLAVARCGQMLSAGRALGLDHATVSRRLATLEAELGAKLLDRRTTGCSVTVSGERLLESAERIEAEMLRAYGAIGAGESSLTGSVRIGTPDGFGTYFLASRLQPFIERHPRLNVELVPLPRSFSLSKREVDIAITLDKPEKGRLFSRKLTDYSLSLYASELYLTKGGMIENEKDLVSHTFVTYVADLVYSPALGYINEISQLAPRRFGVASVAGQLEAVRAGVGFGILHDYAARNVSGIQRILPEIRFTRTYWLAVHASLRGLGRIDQTTGYILDLVASSRRAFV